MISTSQVDNKVTFQQIKAIKTANYNRHYSDCSFLLLNEKDIMKNLHNLSQFLNISDISNEVKNVTSNTFAETGEMFIYLNSCPNDVEKAINYWDIFLVLNILGKPIASIILTLLKTINYATEDGRKISQSILRDLLNKMSNGTNEFERLTQPEKYNFKLLKSLPGTKKIFSVFLEFFENNPYTSQM